MESERRIRIKIEPGEVLVEIVSIVAAILLALAVNAWQDHLHEEHLLRSNVQNIVNELRANRKSIAGLYARHVKAVAILSAPSTGHETMTFDELDARIGKAAPHGFGVLDYQNIAWQIAQADQALALMPYDERARLTAIYQRQEDLRHSYNGALGVLVTQPAPQNGNFYFGLLQMRLQFNDVIYAEAELIRDYDATIPVLERTYDLPAK